MIIDYKKERYKDTFYIFKNRKNGRREVEKQVGFEPYFYIPEDATIPKMGQIKRVDEGDYVDSHGNKLKKIIVKSPGDVPYVRKEFKQHYEADINFVQRFTIDNIGQIAHEKLRIHYLDIENDDSLDIDNAPKPITCITIYDNFLKKYIVFVWREEINERNFKHEDKSIYYFDNEVKMLRTFIGFVQDTDPDILTGWNVDFDMFYIINRMRVLKINFNSLSPMNSVGIGKHDISVKGRVVFDLLKGYSKLKPTVIESRKLDEIGKLELGMEKLKFEGTHGELWRKELAKLIKYNIRDVEILKLLDEKMKIIPYFDELRRLTNCGFNETMWTSSLIDGMLLTKFHNKIIFKSKEYHTDVEKVEGAIVVDPVKGLHHDILHIDLKSLYPSIMISFNMSPETLSKEGDINVGNGIKFNSKNKGVLSVLIKDLGVLREEKKKMRDGEKDEELKKVFDRQQYCVKVIMNAIYGQTNFKRSRIYCPQISESITYVGRKILMATIDKLKGWGYEVIYGDTDGIFLKMQKGTKPQELVKEINKYYNEFCEQFGITNHIFDIEFEKVYKSLILSSKKHYAGILDDGKFEVKGLETVRTDNSKFIRSLQKEILKMIMEDAGKEKVKTFVQKELKKFKNKGYDYEHIAIPRGLTNSPEKYKTTSPWIRGCIYSQNYLNLKFVQGDKARLLYIKTMPPRLPQTNELCFHNNHEVPRGVVVDIDKMLEKGVYRKLKNIFELVDWTINDITGESKTLLEF